MKDTRRASSSSASKEAGGGAPQYSRGYYAYLGVMLTIVVYVFYVMFSSSDTWLEMCRVRPICSRFIRPTWWGGAIDFADDQWRAFRDGLPLLFLGMVAHVGVGSFLRHMEPAMTFDNRMDIAVFASIAFCVILHQWQAVLPIAYASLSYVISHAFSGTQILIPATWIHVLFGLWLKEQRVGLLHARGGMYPWQFSLPLLVLRTASFNFDRHLARKSEAGGDISSLLTYSYRGFFAHAFYPPLYLAGPIIRYDKFEAAIARGAREPARVIGAYAVVLALAIFGIEFLLWKLPVFAMSRAGIAGAPALLPGAALLHCFAQLNAMWLKFVIMWRFARLWARLDGVDPPENMSRYIGANYTVAMFWTGWHRSFNQWIVKYLYVPLGGRHTKHWNVFVVFGFVSLWHDPTLSLAAWGFLNGAFIAAETLLSSLYRPPASISWQADRVLRGIGGTTSLAILSGINLIGYAVGLGGLQKVWDSVEGSDGQPLITVLLSAGCFLFALTQLTFFFESLDFTQGADGGKERGEKQEKEKLLRRIDQVQMV